MLRAGERVKDYEVIAPLRSGGMALLYLARRRGEGGFNRLVVLKLVHPDLVEDAAMTNLFLAEARLSAHVAHPNVVHVEEVGRAAGTYFIAMEYVHGGSLSELLSSLAQRRLRMSPKLCVWVAAQVAEALHAVHEARGENDRPLHIVHRDVSPQNVLVGHSGHVKLIDFGIAKSQPSDDPTGHGRAVLGKLGYMAPEQLRLQRVDRRTDVYALGVLLWEMLAARSLFRCQRVDDERDWATREAPPPPSEFSPLDHEALDRVVLKALSIDPSDRYESAFAFRAALLRAEPAAVQVDAPRFAALMQTLIGDELARRRACLPSEFGAQLDLDVAVTTAKALGIEELTAALRSELEQQEEHDLCDDDSVTVADSPAALRHGGSLSALPRALRVRHAGPPVQILSSAAPSLPVHGFPTASWTEPGTAIAAARRPLIELPNLHSRAVEPRASTLRALHTREPSVIFTSLEARIVTEPSPRSETPSPSWVGRVVHNRKARHAALGALCLAFGVLLGFGLRPTIAPPISPYDQPRRVVVALPKDSPELTARASHTDGLRRRSSARMRASRIADESPSLARPTRREQSARRAHEPHTHHANNVHKTKAQRRAEADRPDGGTKLTSKPKSRSKRSH